MFRSRRNLLEVEEDTESGERVGKSHLNGIKNPSFDYTTESSIHSEQQKRPPRLQVNSYHDSPIEEDLKKPVPLPRSRIPIPLDKKATNKQLNESVEVRKGFATNEQTGTNDSSSNSVPLTTFVVNNERKRSTTRTGKAIEESSVVSSTDDLSSSQTNDERPYATQQQSSRELEVKATKHQKKKRARSNKRDFADSDTGKDDAIGIYIHELEYLKYTMDLEAVYVRVSLYDQSNGQLLRKVNHEGRNNTLEEIEPILTRHCRFRSASYLNCIWEQLILFEEATKIVRNDKCIILYEVLVKSELSVDLKPVAFAFLKPFLENQFNHFDKRLALQVYYFNSKFDVYQNWINLKKTKKFPSTLGVTLKSIQKVQGNKAATNKDHDVKEQKVFEIEGISAKMGGFGNCHVVGSSLNLSGKGTNILKIDPSGTLIAIANPGDNGLHAILICTLADHKTVQILEGHSDFIYDIKWKESDKRSSPDFILLSCSADHTLVVWTILADFKYSFIVVPHVTFVYCCEFWTKDFLISAGRDSIIRVWEPHNGTIKVHQELSNGTGYVTSLVVSHKNSRLYTGNSDSVVVEWLWTSNTFEYHRKIFDGKSKISHIELHSRIEKIFIGVQPGDIFCLALESLVIIQRFQCTVQSVPNRFFHFKLSNCGMFLIAIAGGPDVQCWNIATGKQEPLFRGLLKQTGTLSTIDLPKKGSFVVLGRYMANKQAVVVLVPSESNSNDRTTKAVGDSITIPVDTERTTAVKNKLHEIIEKIDQVLVLPQLCDDEKIHLSQDMITEKRRIEEWLDKNIQGSNDNVAQSDAGEGTFDIHRAGSIKSNGTFTIETAKEKRNSRGRSKEDESDHEVNCGTYEIKKTRDTDADDTSASDSVFK